MLRKALEARGYTWTKAQTARRHSEGARAQEYLPSDHRLKSRELGLEVLRENQQADAATGVALLTELWVGLKQRAGSGDERKER